MTKNKEVNGNTVLWDILKKHRGHHVSIVYYGDWDIPCSICLECDDCEQVLLDAEFNTVCAREDC